MYCLHPAFQIRTTLMLTWITFHSHHSWASVINYGLVSNQYTPSPIFDFFPPKSFTFMKLIPSFLTRSLVSQCYHNAHWNLWKFFRTFVNIDVRNQKEHSNARWPFRVGILIAVTLPYEIVCSFVYLCFRLGHLKNFCKGDIVDRNAPCYVLGLSAISIIPGFSCIFVSDLAKLNPFEIVPTVFWKLHKCFTF